MNQNISLPFSELTLENIKNVIEFCEGIRRFYREQNPTGFWGIDYCMTVVLPLEDLKLQQLYEGLSTVALQELIALKIFGGRGKLGKNSWRQDLKEARREMSNPSFLEGHAVGDYLRQGLINMVRVGMIPRNPLD